MTPDPHTAVAVWAVLYDADRQWCRQHPSDAPMSGPRLAGLAATLVEQGVRPPNPAASGPDPHRAEIDRLRWENANLRALLGRLVHAVTGRFNPDTDLTEQATAAAATVRSATRHRAVAQPVALPVAPPGQDR